MKPQMHSIGGSENKPARSQSFPVTDFNYHSISLGDCDCRCGRLESPSFHTLSRDYFKTEANQYFLAEAIVFGAIMATAALPLLSGAHAVLHLVSSLGGI